MSEFKVHHREGEGFSVLELKGYLDAHTAPDLENTFQEIEMVAENLGRIPPNTALLIVTAGTKRYRLYLTSTEQKSAMVRFIYEPSLSSQAKVPGN